MTTAADQGPSSPRARRAAYLVLLAGTLIIGMGQTVVFAVLPPIARGLGLHDLQVLSIFMTSATFWVTFGPFWGRLSDDRGRRPFILLGLSAYAASMTLFATMIELGARGLLAGGLLYALLLITRSIYGLFGSAMPPAAQAYIADRTTPDNRTSELAGFSAAFGLGAMVGPAFAGALGGVDPVAPLYGVAALAATAVCAIALRLNEKTAPKERAARPTLSPFDPRIRSFLAYGLATATVTAIPTQFASFYVIDRLGFDDASALSAAGVVLSTAAGASLFAQIALVQRFRLKPYILLRVGPALLAIGHLTIAFSTELGAMAFGMMISGLGAGLVAPGYVGGASLAVSIREQGAVAGLSNAAASSSFIIAPPIGYLVYSTAPQSLFIATSVLATAAFLFAVLQKTFGAGDASVASPS
ncbi:MAG: MFS transporter [Alphaproteobacteria bacterium]|nr:MFS transporter [Alphaproteobacteria bacterium]